MNEEQPVQENQQSQSRISEEPEEEGAPTVATVGATLAVDIGSLYTRAALFDVVGNEYRFVGRGTAVTTAEAPSADVTAGIYNAVREIEAATGRLLTEGTRLVMPQRRDTHGIDLFIATSSAAPALRLVVASVSSGISGESAMRAAQSTYTQIISTIDLDEGLQDVTSDDDARVGSAALAWLQKETDKLLALPPDVVLIAGGVDGGPVSPLVRIARVVGGAAREQTNRAERAARAGKSAPGRPMALYAGNSAALPHVTQALAPISEVRAVPNLRPSLEVEQVGPAEEALSEMYREERMPLIPGYPVLQRWIEGSLVPTAQAERLITRYLHAHYGRETLLADVGAASTSLFLASADGDDAVVRGDLGMAHTLGNLLTERGARRILRWLPFEMTEEDLADWVLNKVIRPLSLPQTARDLAIEHALAREALVAAAESLSTRNGGRPPRFDLMIGTGGLLAHTPRPGQAALLMLDALQPVAEALGSVELALDTTLLVPALGNLARHHLAAAAYIFDRDCLVWLGTAIVVQGGPAEAGGGPQTAVTLTIDRQQGGSETVEVPYGSIQVVPLRPDQRAALTVKPAAGFRVGGGEPGKALKTQPGQEVKGGLVGLIIDARGRPLRLPADNDTRNAAIRRWWAAFDAIPSGETFTSHLFAAPESQQQITSDLPAQAVEESTASTEETR